MRVRVRGKGQLGKMTHQNVRARGSPRRSCIYSTPQRAVVGQVLVDMLDVRASTNSTLVLGLGLVLVWVTFIVRVSARVVVMVI